MIPYVALTLFAVATLLVCEHRGFRPGIWVAKPVAASGFIATALAAGALGSFYGRWVLGALVLSWLGDVLLIPRGAPRIFRAGALSFLLGHLVFSVAFSVRGIDSTAAGVALVAILIPGLPLLRWLRPHVPPAMKGTVYAYVIVISTMVICAAGAAVQPGRGAILIGAAMFYVSDLAVARDRFVAPAVSNKFWGLPLYFGGQLVLASTVAS